MTVWDFFAELFGYRTPKGMETLGLIKDLSIDKDLVAELKNFIVGSGTAIVVNGEEAQSFADVLSLTVYTTVGRSPYRATVRLKRSDISGIGKKDLERELQGRKVIFVDASYNKDNEEYVEREFSRNGYKLAGVMYMSPHPPYGHELMLTPPQREIPETAKR